MLDTIKNWMVIYLLWALGLAFCFVRGIVSILKWADGNFLYVGFAYIFMFLLGAILLPFLFLTTKIESEALKGCVQFLIALAAAIIICIIMAFALV